MKLSYTILLVSCLHLGFSIGERVYRQTPEGYVPATQLLEQIRITEEYVEEREKLLNLIRSQRFVESNSFVNLEI